MRVQFGNVFRQLLFAVCAIPNFQYGISEHSVWNGDPCGVDEPGREKVTDKTRQKTHSHELRILLEIRVSFLDKSFDIFYFLDRSLGWSSFSLFRRSSQSRLEFTKLGRNLYKRFLVNLQLITTNLRQFFVTLHVHWVFLMEHFEVLFGFVQRFYVSELLLPVA